MDPVLLILLLIGAGAALLVGELLLPTHGLLGIAGLLCFGGAIGVCFYINRWLGLIVFCVAVLASPFLASLGLKIWQRTPVGRRIILPPVQASRAASPVIPGQIGITVTEMRPIGECDFGDVRVEAISELGLIPPGTRVRVVAVENNRPVVRAADA
ncbi:MAG TPA: NfeD family protein [Tepidisphaeraceae bacterium]|nr:NfeD family protein [Tepidisphaeraceae bacterium]